MTGESVADISLTVCTLVHVRPAQTIEFIGSLLFSVVTGLPQ